MPAVINYVLNPPENRGFDTHKQKAIKESRLVYRRLTLRILIPITLISLLLLGLGIVAAWNAQRQQFTTQNLIVAEINRLLVAQRFYMRGREILELLQQYNRTKDKSNLDTITHLKPDSDVDIDTAKSWDNSEEEKHYITSISQKYGDFWLGMEEAKKIQESSLRDEALLELANRNLLKEIISTSEQYMNHCQSVVTQTNKISQQITNLTRQGFLLLGMFGCAGGLIAGWGISRAIQKSLIRLEISVKGVADRLGPVTGPVTFSQEGGLNELEAGLSQMEDHVCSLVERLQHSELQVIRNEQLAALGQLAAGLAHEMRNPLMPIKVLVQTAIDRKENHQLSPQALEVIDHEIKRLEECIQSFLDYARPQAPVKTRFNLRERVEETLRLVVSRAFQQNININFEPGHEDIFLKADSNLIHQVLLNLILNALDAISNEGDIFIRIWEEENYSEPNVLIEVGDTGPGLSPDVLKKIFEPFVTTKETGTGLGLSICQRIVQAHGGTITCGNREQGGAYFKIRLPQVAEKSPQLTM